MEHGCHGEEDETEPVTSMSGAVLVKEIPRGSELGAEAMAVSVGSGGVESELVLPSKDIVSVFGSFDRPEEVVVDISDTKVEAG